MSGNNESQTFIDRVVGFSLASWINCIISVIATPITTAVFPPFYLVCKHIGPLCLYGFRPGLYSFLQ